MEKIISLYHQIYDGISVDNNGLQVFLNKLESYKESYKKLKHQNTADWYKDAVVYSTYVDLFNKDFKGLKDKLPYLQNMGVNCLWLLPILESPMKDAGFDISDYETVRADLCGLDQSASNQEKDDVFVDFIQAAHASNINVIFDVAMNHCSNQHKWFQEARKSKDSPYRNYFIWNDDTEKYKDARIIFKGMCDSNWQYDEVAKQYYFHRFFEIQPDLNYRNPELLFAMTNMLINWRLKGVDGFRADAVPYLWKDENTICENLPKTHLIVQFFKASLDYLNPGNLLLAEANQPPKQVAEYFGGGHECNAAYHFPVMPRIFKALAQEDCSPVKMVMDPSFTPEIPESCQWFNFLRCHDELTLEMVSAEERKILHDYYVKDPLWDFRQGEGISSRLANLFDEDAKRIKLAYSIMFTLIGTPIIYYGDEVGKTNDLAYYNDMFKMTGYKDSRYLGRGHMDWNLIDQELKDPNSLASQIYLGIKEMTTNRAKHPSFARGTLKFVDVNDKNGLVNKHILAYERATENDKVLVVQNLSKEKQNFDGSSLGLKELNALEAFEYQWISR